MPRHRVKLIFKQALPIVGGLVLQNIMGLIDLMMVAHLGNAAIAAVGISAFAGFLCVAFLVGLSSSVQAVASRREGEGSGSQTAIPLNGGLILSLAIGLPLTVLAYCLVPPLFPLLNSAPEVIQRGIPYLRIHLLSLVGMGMGFAFRGYWNGTNRSVVYLKSIVVTNLINIGISYVLIFGKAGFPEMGTTGAALGTTISTYIGLGYSMWLGLSLSRENGFLRRLPSLASMRTLLRLTTPSGMQRAFHALGFNLLFMMVGKLGIREVACTHVLINLLSMATLPGMGFGMAAGSFVGQELGRHKLYEAKKWGWDTVKIALCTLVLIGLPMIFTPKTLLSLFIHQKETLALATRPLQIVGVFMSFEALGLIMMNTLLVAGDAHRVFMINAGLQWLLFLPAAYLVGLKLGFGLLGIWIALMSYRGIQSIIYSLLWHGEKWGTIRI
ncbi:MAG: MATE family efflux transporter [Deltaproteobacteria bacterium]|nr:MATE family efflux transporter [Deltaproteobacteria bacterium]